MGLMNKLAFWKKDEFDDFKGFDDKNSMGDMNSDPMADIGKDSLADMNHDPFANDPLKSSQDRNFDNFDSNMRKAPPVNDLGLGGQGDANSFDSVTQTPTKDPFGPESQAGPASPNVINKDIEIISAKIDTIKVSIEYLGHKLNQMDQRLIGIEKIAKSEQDIDYQNQNNHQVPKW